MWCFLVFSEQRRENLSEHLKMMKNDDILMKKVIFLSYFPPGTLQLPRLNTRTDSRVGSGTLQKGSPGASKNLPKTTKIIKMSSKYTTFFMKILVFYNFLNRNFPESSSATRKSTGLARDYYAKLPNYLRNSTVRSTHFIN